MRITGGKYRGRKITCPPGEIRPAMDRMRESLFSILGNMEGDSFLDLFSGSGVVGIEAASRNASPVVLVEKDFKKKNVILGNISFVEEDISLTLSPVERFLERTAQRFDIVYLDPPFAYKKKDTLLNTIGSRKILSDEGICVIHMPAEDKSPENVENLSVTDERKYGRSRLYFLQYE